MTASLLGQTREEIRNLDLSFKRWKIDHIFAAGDQGRGGPGATGKDGKDGKAF